MVNNLMGMFFPVKDVNNTVVGKRKINRVFQFDNHAAVGIQSDVESNSLLLLTYVEVNELMNNQDALTSLKEI